jgi:hypothetical protein
MRVDTCDCCMSFEMPSSTDVATSAATEVEQQFGAWVEQRISGAGRGATPLTAKPPNLTALMTLLWPLSLDGGLHVAYALGTAAGYEEDEEDPGRHTLKHPRAPLAKARHVLAMAGELAGKIARLKPVRLRVSRPSVVVGLLAESASAQATPEDRGLAQSILLTVLGQKKTRWTGVHPQLSQLTLF